MQPIPFLGSLSGGLHHGRMIRISGEILHQDWYGIRYGNIKIEKCK